MHTEEATKNAFGIVITGLIENVILLSRYLLVPLYFGILYEILSITFDFFHVLLGSTESLNLNQHMLEILELVDITMIANLVWLISAGSYYVFVHPYPSVSLKKRPRSLAHVSTGILKEKMAGSLIGVSSVHLLQTFLEISESTAPVNLSVVGVLIAIHLMFIFGLLAFNYANAADHHQHTSEKETTNAETH